MKSPLAQRPFEMLALGCSAGGIEALKLILTRIRPPFRPSIVVVQHIAPLAYTTLADFFAEICHVPVKEAEDKEPIRPGTIYFAPAGYHLLIENDRSFSLSVDAHV
ncbi:MAG: chemotaxis protein CheB, partial [Proteobacteria bacterium]